MLGGCDLGAAWALVAVVQELQMGVLALAGEALLIALIPLAVIPGKLASIIPLIRHRIQTDPVSIADHADGKAFPAAGQGKPGRTARAPWRSRRNRVQPDW
jgi:hypothetical protein